jgi:hypothetical protein
LQVRRGAPPRWPLGLCSESHSAVEVMRIDISGPPDVGGKRS